MNIALDTNRYVDALADRDGAGEVLRAAVRVFVPFVVVGELRAGFLCGSRPRENEAVLARFLDKPSASILYAGPDTPHHYARIFTQLKIQGTPIPTNDLWIAALVQEHGLHLYSRDQHFDHLPQLLRAG